VQWLIDSQRDDGTWDEEPFTGTGFPKVFYLKYHMYSLYFPLMALCRSGGLGFEDSASRLNNKGAVCDSH
jgi:squalene cyclase